jgi:hypothetical protein
LPTVIGSLRRSIICPFSLMLGLMVSNGQSVFGLVLDLGILLAMGAVLLLINTRLSPGVAQ